VTPQEARARADSVMELHESGAADEAFVEVERLLTELATGHDLTDPVLRESLFTARFERAVLLTEREDLDAAADAYALAAQTPADLDDPDQRHEIALAALNHGICLDALGDHASAAKVYAAIVERLGEADDPVTADQVARARVNHAAALLALDRVEEAASVAGEVIEALDPSDVLDAEQHAMALRIRAEALTAAGYREEAIATLSRAARVTGEDAGARAQRAAAAREQGLALVELGRTAEAIEVFDAALVDAATEQDPEVRDVLEDIRVERERLAGR